jgi:hypothetical protein
LAPNAPCGGVVEEEVQLVFHRHMTSGAEGVFNDSLVVQVLLVLSMLRWRSLPNNLTRPGTLDAHMQLEVSTESSDCSSLYAALVEKLAPSSIAMLSASCVR